MRLSINSLSLALFLLLGSTSSAFAATDDWSDNWRVGIKNGDNMIEEHRLHDAEECFKETLKEVKRQKHSHDDLALVEGRLADTLQMRDIMEDSLPLYRKALHQLEKAHGKDSELLMPDLMKIGQIFEAEREPKHAAKIYRRTLKISEKSQGPESVAYADSLYRIGRTDTTLGQMVKAQLLFRRAIGIVMAQTELSDGFPLLSFLNDYVDLLKKNEHPEKILTSEFQTQLLKDPLGQTTPATAVAPSEWQKEVAARLAKSLPAPQTETDLVRTTTPLAAADNYGSSPGPVPEGQSQDFFERMVAVDIKSLGPDNPVVANDLIALSSLFIAQERYSEAKPLLERALKIYGSVYDEDNILVKRTRQSIVEVCEHIEMGQHGDTVRAEMPPLPRIPLAAKSIEIARRLNELAFRTYAQGQVDEALTFYGWALSSTVSATGARSELVAGCCSDYSRVLRSAQKVETAVQLEKVARSILTEAKFAVNMPVK
jgi:tetratricopeptide (TPR) repeat protein